MNFLGIVRRATFWIGAAFTVSSAGFGATSTKLETYYGLHNPTMLGGAFVHPMYWKGMTVYLSADQLAAMRDASDRAYLLAGVGFMLVIGSYGLEWFERRSNKAHGAPPVTG